MGQRAANDSRTTQQVYCIGSGLSAIIIIKLYIERCNVAPDATVVYLAQLGTMSSLSSMMDGRTLPSMDPV